MSRYCNSHSTTPFVGKEYSFDTNWILNQASIGDPFRSGVGVLEGVLEGVLFVSGGDLLPRDLEDDLERDLECEFLLLLSLLELRFTLLPTGEGDRELDRERLSERAGDFSTRRLGDLDADLESDLLELSGDPREPGYDPRAERGEPVGEREGERECERDLVPDLLRELDLPRLERL